MVRYLKLRNINLFNIFILTIVFHNFFKDMPELIPNGDVIFHYVFDNVLITNGLDGVEFSIMHQ